MMQFAEVFPDPEIVVSLIRQLSWTHILALIPLKEPLQREFYAEMCRVERWSVRTLRDKIGSMLYERTAISRKPEEVARAELTQLREDDRFTPTLVFKDPYVLDFLGLNDRYLERDLEDAILREIETFLLELGDGFAFLGRQKRIQIDFDDFYLDLLFYHRRLRRLIAIDLKLGDFKAEYKGQMELYLRWLAKHEQQAGEESPLGLILCAGKKEVWNRLDLVKLDQMNFTEMEESRLALLPDDLLVCEGGSIGRTALWRGEAGSCYYQNHLHRLRSLNGRVDPQFVVYWFWYAFDVGKLYFGRGNVTTIPNLSRSKLAELPIAVPPLSEQKKITHVLSTVQRAIGAQERIIQTTAELKKALMHKLFTEGTRGEPQKQTEIGPVPESWEVLRVSDVAPSGLWIHKVVAEMQELH